MSYSVNIRCPYYETMANNKKKQATITCQNMERNLGFDIKNQIVFRCHEEKDNYVELFCQDMYETCPYYKGIYEREEAHEKEKSKSDRKSTPCRKKAEGGGTPL